MKDKRIIPVGLELVAGGLGLAAALALGILRVVNDVPPNRSEEAFGNTVLILLLMTPYIGALLSTIFPIRVRWVILLPSALLSLSSFFISMAGAGVVFLPALVLLTIATVRSLRPGPLPGLSRVLFFLGALTVTAITVMAFVFLFLNQDARSWEYVTYADGRTTWKSVPATPGIFIQGPLPTGAVSSGGKSTSDIITNGEAARSLGLLAVGLIGFAVLGHYATKRYPDNDVIEGKGLTPV